MSRWPDHQTVLACWCPQRRRALSEPTYELHPKEARWTHIALRVPDIDAMIEWYEDLTPLRLLDRREDEAGYGAWLAMPDMVDPPFILVLAQFFPETDPFKDAPLASLGPFAHFGIEMTEQRDVDAIAERGKQADCLAMPPTMMPPPIGYICMLRDPAGNMVEFSWDQGVYATTLEKWGASTARSG